MRNLVGFGLAALFAALPATSTYQLNSYGFGSGGTAGSSTSTYSLEGQTGELNGPASSTTTYSNGGGFVQTQQANVPTITVDNASGQYYNKLHFVIVPNSHDPSDAKYLVAVSTVIITDMNVATNSTNNGANVYYVQPDGTLSPTLSNSDYQTYSTWGSGSGSFIIGLTPSTTYYIAVRSTQGKFTESAYGPVVTQATAAPSLTFSLSPNSVNLGTINPGSGTVYASPSITASITTNAASGGNIYINGKNGGLKSGSTGYQINAVSNDLSSLSEGFGAQNSSVSQTSGGPLSAVSPYNSASNIVGLVNGTLRSLYTSTSAITGGSGVLVVKAKAASTDVAATDYQEVLTLVAAGNF